MSDGGGVLRETALHGEHVRLGGKMVPFAGFDLPVQYPSGIHTEHRAVRSAVGLFDVSHMGEFEVTGTGAADLIQTLTVNDVSVLSVGRAQYSMLCNDAGGVVDDLLVCRLTGDAYLLVVNAVNRERALAWIRSRIGSHDARVEDRSDETALIAVQGPRAPELLSRVCELDHQGLRPFRLRPAEVDGREAIVSRTGYTGEDGFEIYIDPGEAVPVWRALLEAGADLGVLPCGLGARDTLRIEAGLPLHGAELDEEHTPLEAGQGKVVKLDKGPFVGRDALLAQRVEGLQRKLVGIRLSQRGFPRSGYPVVWGGAEVGVVTSGTTSPSSGAGIAMAYVPAEAAELGTEVAIRIRGRDVPGTVVPLPFHTTRSEGA